MRRLLPLLFLLFLCTFLKAQKTPCLAPGLDEPFLGIRTVRLWPGDAPEAKGKACEDIPSLTIFEPKNAHPNGSGVIVLPGGAYVALAGTLEGRQVADWFTARGFKAFVLEYRQSSNGYLLPVPLLDARRAVQMVRANATEFHVHSDRIVMIGFSAGGHLAALSATQPVSGNSEAADPIERVSSRPDYLVLAYPWIGAISRDTTHLTYCKLFGVMDSCEEIRKLYSPELFVTKDTPPTFWYHTFDDQTVPLEQGMRFYEALVRAGVPSEAHIFPHGAHGSGLGNGDPVLDQWPDLLEKWLRAEGLMPSSNNAQ